MSSHWDKLGTNTQENLPCSSVPRWGVCSLYSALEGALPLHSTHRPVCERDPGGGTVHNPHGPQEAWLVETKSQACLRRGGGPARPGSLPCVGLSERIPLGFP